MKDDNCQNLFNLHVHFPDLIPNSYDILNNMKLNLNVSTPQGHSVLVQTTRAFSFSVHKLGWLQVSSKCFALYFLKGTHQGICRNWISCTWARLFIFVASYLPTYRDTSHIFKILPNVRSTINGKKANSNL